MVYTADFEQLLGVGTDALYFARSDLDDGPATLVRRPTHGVEQVLTTSTNGGFAVDDGAIYWTEPGQLPQGRGGVWRAAPPGWMAEQVAVGSPVPGFLAVNSSQLFFAEGHWLMSVAKHGGPTKRLVDTGAEVNEVVADDTAVYWTGFDDRAPPSWLKRLELAGAATPKLLASIRWVPSRLKQAGDQIYFRQFTGPGAATYAVPKRGGEATVLAEGPWGEMVVAEDGVYALPENHGQQTLPLALHRVRSPDATPEIVYSPRVGFRLRGLMAARGQVYVGESPIRPQPPRP